LLFQISVKNTIIPKNKVITIGTLNSKDVNKIEIAIIKKIMIIAINLVFQFLSSSLVRLAMYNPAGKPAINNNAYNMFCIILSYFLT